MADGEKLPDSLERLVDDDYLAKDGEDAHAQVRALACLGGLALGDALGMPTQSRSRADIVAD